MYPTLLWRAVVVDLPFLKKCLWSARGSAFYNVSWITAPRVFAGGESRLIGMKLEPSSNGLLGLRREIMQVVSHGERLHIESDRC